MATPPEPRRTCHGCGRPADCVDVKNEYSRHLYAGTRRSYVCAGCGTKFSVTNAFAIVTGFVGALGFSSCGVLGLTWLGIPYIGVFLLLAAAIIGAVAVHDTWQRLRHPEA